MAIAVKNRAVNVKTMQQDQQNVRNMVPDSYQDMLDGKGRDYKEFFAEMASRYKNADL